ncbi:MAG: hypothetical protein ACERKD_05940 [Prolixibacteraceae bacterium]
MASLPLVEYEGSRNGLELDGVGKYNFTLNADIDVYIFAFVFVNTLYSQ